MKNKLKIIKIAIIFLVSTITLNAQESVQGIFVTSNDFRMNKISYAPLMNKKYKISLHDVFYKSVINIQIGDSIFTIKKESIFGYSDIKNTVFRFKGNSLYKVINPTENILLYSKTVLGGFKNLQTITKFYFSQNDSSAILPLTKWNLKNAFMNDSAFHELLDMEFSNDNDLMQYDNFYKMYKLNRVFQFAHQLIQSAK